jgi:hypothetical protein
MNAQMVLQPSQLSAHYTYLFTSLTILFISFADESSEYDDEDYYSSPPDRKFIVLSSFLAEELSGIGLNKYLLTDGYFENSLINSY